MPRIVRRYWKPALIIASIGVLIALSCWLVLILPSNPHAERSLVAVSHPMNGVTFVARLETNRLSPDQPHSMHLELLSPTTYTPASLKVCADLPGESPVCQDWPVENGQLAHNMDLTFTPGAQTLSEFLTVTILASRYPPPNTGKPAPHASSAMGSGMMTFEENILRLGPLRVEEHSAATDALLRFLERARGILKDITLPLLIPLLGIYFARQASRKAEQDEVRRALLGKVQGLTKQFYTHLVHHARDAITALNAKKFDEATYNLLGVPLFNYRLKEQEGAVFFSSLSGEHVYAGCISFLVGHMRELLGGEQAYRGTLDAFGNLRKPPTPPATTGITAIPAPPAPGPTPPAPGVIAPPPGSAPAPAVAVTPAAIGTNATEAMTPPPRLADFLNAKFATLPKLTADPVLISTLDFLVAVTSYEYDAPLYEHWYRLPGKVVFEERFPTIAELNNLPKSPDTKRKAWKSLLKESRLWLADKSSDQDYLKALPRFE